MTRSGTNQVAWFGVRISAQQLPRCAQLLQYAIAEDRFSRTTISASSLGGPIVKDKTFFFGSLRRATGASGIAISCCRCPLPRRSTVRGALRRAEQFRARRSTRDWIDHPEFLPGKRHRTIPCVWSTTKTIRQQLHREGRPQLYGKPATDDGAMPSRKAIRSFRLGSPGGFGTGSRLAQFAQTSPARVQVFRPACFRP